MAGVDRGDVIALILEDDIWVPVDALRQAEEAARDAVRALFGEELLERAGPEFDALLDLALYALRGMALDAHVATEADRRARADLILGLEPYFAHALTEEQ